MPPLSMAGGSIHIHKSNQTEVLVDALSALLGDPVGGPLEREWIVVHGRGMAVWLSTELARRHGVWAGDHFLFPRRFVERAFELALGEDAAPAPCFSRERLVWAVASVLGPLLEKEELAPLARYLEGDSDRSRRFALASRIADTFDHYLTYRPEMVLAWEKGEDGPASEDGERWQPLLWRELVRRFGGRHLAALEREFLKAMLRGSSEVRVPRRVVVFGLSSLPPMYVRIIAALAHHAEVHLMLPSPAVGFWEDLCTPAAVERARSEGAAPEALHMEIGNPLLASLGRLGAELSRVLTAELEALGVAEREHDRYREPRASGDLGRVQADILHVRHSAPTDPPDASIAVHACHGPMREVEVLHDQLLAWLTGGDLQPHEVVVMMPDVDAYAPLIEAVFERDRGDPRFIPYSISDRSVRRDSPVVDAFQRILVALERRVSAAEVLDLLTLEPVRDKLGITAADVDTLAGWIVGSGVRWGIDAAHRQRFDQPGLAANTWRFGLDRLLLGYALPADGARLFRGTLPFDGIEGQASELLGKLASFCERLFEAVRLLREPRSMAAWRDALVSLSDAMLSDDAAYAWERQRLAEALEELAERAEDADMHEPIGLEVVRRLIEQAIDHRYPARGFLAGGVTFCALVPMRAIPFRVVCLLGMSDGAFPRRRQPPEFDLIAKGPRRPGDRSRRDDDRYLFLEAILSARERLMITYTGQSIRDNSSLPPSVVVSDLLEATDGGDQRVLRHPLQPFSPRYFDGSDPRLFSYAADYAAAAARAGDPREPPGLFAEPLPPDEEAAAGPLSLYELLRFAEGPARYLMERRLGIDLRADDPEIPEREPLSLSPLERYQLGQRLLALRLAGVDAAESLLVARASGELVAGAAGDIDHRALLAEVDPLVARVEALTGGERVESAPVELALPGGERLVGELGPRRTQGVVESQFARASGKHLLSLWIRHLVLCAVAAEGEARTSSLVARGKAGEGPAVFRLRPVAEPERHLAELVRLYRVGLCEPLRLLPRTSYRYAEVYRQRGGGERGHQAALGSSGGVYEDELRRDPYARRAFGDGPLSALAAPPPRERGFAGPGLAEASLVVFEPLLEHLEEGWEA